MQMSEIDTFNQLKDSIQYQLNELHEVREVVQLLKMMDATEIALLRDFLHKKDYEDVNHDMLVKRGVE